MKGDISRSTFDQRRHATSVRKQQGRVDLDADWNEQQDIQAHLRATALTDVVGATGAPLAGGAFALTGGADLTLSAGRYYLDGLLCENDAQVSVFAQPDLPAAGPFVRRLDGSWLPTGTPVPAGVYAAWLQVWPQHVTAIEDPGLREVALGGPDTATRLRTVWQVRLVQAGPPGTPVGCADTPPGWAGLTAASTGTLAVRADPTGAAGGDCVIPTGSPYTGLDNQYYRVEILTGGAPGTASYVWSRDNASTVATWESIDVDVLTVKVPGRDGSAGFANGSWVELTDDSREQNGVPGTLVQVDRVEGDRIVVRPATATGSLNRADFPSRPRVRRWDGRGTVPAGGAELDLELGIKIRFAASGGYRTGDWWSFPARASVHDVEWPRVGTTPVPQTPHGPRRSHGRLGVVGYDGSQWSVLRDCRPVFAPLTGQLTLSLLGGDGQEAVPVPASPATLVPLGHDLGGRRRHRRPARRQSPGQVQRHHRPGPGGLRRHHRRHRHRGDGHRRAGPLRLAARLRHRRPGGHRRPARRGRAAHRPTADLHRRAVPRRPGVVRPDRAPGAGRIDHRAGRHQPARRRHHGRLGDGDHPAGHGLGAGPDHPARR